MHAEPSPGSLSSLMFETGSYSVAQDVPEFIAVLLPQPPKRRNYRLSHHTWLMVALCVGVHVFVVYACVCTSMYRCTHPCMLSLSHSFLSCSSLNLKLAVLTRLANEPSWDSLALLLKPQCWGSRCELMFLAFT